MDFLFDHQTFSLQKYGGISRYFSELIYGINNSTHHKAYLSLLYTNNVYAHDLHLAEKYFFPNTDFSKKLSLLYNLNKTVSTVDLMTRSYDLIHATYYDPYFLRYAGRRPTVVTFLDMIHERFSSQFTELSADRAITARKEIAAKRAKHIIAISESTKNDIVNIFNINPDKISVIYLGSSFKQLNDSREEKKFDEGSPYILYVGHRGHYKNFNFFLKSIASLLKKYGLKVICAGGGRFTDEEQTYIISLGLKDQVIQEFIDDQKLRVLYSEAVLFVFPSLYEGFGIPVLEAFSCGCPCALSNQSSLPEIAGEAAVFFDPTDSDSIRSIIDGVLSDYNLRISLVKKGYQRAALFSWQRTVSQTVSVYEKITLANR